MAKQKKKSRWLGRILLLLLLAAAASIAWFFLAPTFKTVGTGVEYLPYTVESRDITTSLSFSGTAEVLHTQQITTAEGQSVREIFVEESQTVKKDDPLIQLEDGEIHTAGMDGVVNQIRAREGGYAMPGQPLVQVCDLDNLQITLSVDEYDISRFSIGQPCSMYFLALSQQAVCDKLKHKVTLQNMVMVAIPGHPHGLNSANRAQITFTVVQTWRCLGCTGKCEKQRKAHLRS